MNKKGQGLPLNTVVVAILVIVVLILVLTFFFGGFTGLSMKIRQIFFGSLAGTGKTLARQQCNQYCNQLQLTSYSLEEANRPGVFNNFEFCKCRGIDTDEDGQADENLKCDDPGLGVSCSYMTTEGSSVNVDCTNTCPVL